MFDKIAILITLLILIYLIYRQIKTTETFEDSKTFIAMKKNDPKTLLFYNQSNTTDDKYKIINLPNLQSIKQYVYQKGVLVVLTPEDKILYCTNCNLISGNIEWNVISNSFGSISRIALNDNKLFVLYSNGIIGFMDNFTNPRSRSSWNVIEMPPTDRSFKYMDAQYNHLVAIGSLTNFIYHKDITPTGFSANWTIIDKSKIMNSIKVTLHGYLGKTTPNELYKCKFPCDGNKADSMWTLINNDLTSSINANSEIISLIKNNTLFSCDEICSPASMLPLSNPLKYNLDNAQVLDFIYPKLDILPTLAPLDESILKVNQFDDKIKDKINKHQTVETKINDINNKIQQFLTVQSQFENNYNTMRNQRDQLISTVMNKIGVSNQEQFSDSILLENVMGHVKEKINIHSDEQEIKKGGLTSNLIVAL